MSYDNGDIPSDWRPTPNCYICGKYASNIKLHSYTKTSYVQICDKCFEKLFPDWRNIIGETRKNH